MIKPSIALFAAATCCLPTIANASNTTVKYYTDHARQSKIPEQLSKNDARKFRAIFSAIKSENWVTAQNLVKKAPKGTLRSIAKAELFLSANSPRVEMGPLLTLLNEAPNIPQAEQLGRLAKRRGATALPRLPVRKRLVSYRGAPKRGKPRPTGSNRTEINLRSKIVQFIKNDAPSAAENLLRKSLNSVNANVQTELKQRVSWSYYIENKDREAKRLAIEASQGSGEWASYADWTAGLSAWRLNDCRTAARSFEAVARRASNVEMRAAGLFWGARANIVCGEPHKVQSKLQTASQYSETFYGILSAEALGMDPMNRASTIAFTKSDWTLLKNEGNISLAVALSQLGEQSLSDELLRHHAKLSGAKNHASLVRLARELNLPRTQIWLGHHGQRGNRPQNFARYPAPKWKPTGGWRVDPALVFAHTLQESNFRSKVISPAGARGLMQVRPGTAQDIARKRGVAFTAASLNNPSTNMEYGQSYLEQLRDMSLTGGLLPKIVAAYNAGPSPVLRWNSEINDNGDPLLFIESIPYGETRAYVGIILRNYWMYEHQAGVKSPSLIGLAQGLWPRFPGMSGQSAVRLNQKGRGNSAD